MVQDIDKPTIPHFEGLFFNNQPFAGKAFMPSALEWINPFPKNPYLPNQRLIGRAQRPAPTIALIHQIKDIDKGVAVALPKSKIWMRA